MRRPVPLGRLLAALLTVVAVTLGPVGRADARTGQDVDMQTPDDDAAIDDLVGCLQGTGHLLVLFLIDESASLKNNDPDDRRVDAAQSALDSLRALATTADTTPPDVEVALAAFANEYVEASDWTDLGRGDADAVQGALEEFRNRKSGIDTDFVNALSAGRELLADRAAEVTASGDAAPCKAVFLFTDGGYDLAVRKTEADIERLGLTKTYAPGIELTNEEDVRRAEKAGREEMCRVGGLADQVRGDDITLLTLALASNVPPMAQRLLAAASGGEALGYTCGRPQDRPTGAYLPASGVEILIERFDEVATRLAGGTLLPNEADLVECGAAPCPDGTATFELDGSLRRAHLLALPSHAGARVAVSGPAGSVEIEEPGRYAVGGVAVEVTAVAERGFAIDLVRPTDPAGWTGAWSASVLDPTGEHEGDPTILRVFVYSDIGIAFGELGGLTRGSALKVNAVVQVAASGSEELETELTAATVVARFTDPVTKDVRSVELTGPPAGPFVGTFDVPADFTSNAVEATLELRATTDTGAAIRAQAASQELLVRRPGASIQFLPASLQLPSVSNQGTATGQLTLVGGKAAGCVWFGPTEGLNLPKGTSGVGVTIDGEPLPGKGSCLPVGAGELINLALEVDPAGRGTGSVNGVLELHEEVEGAEATTTALAFRFDLTRGVDETQRIVLTLALLAGGIAIPLLLLLLINTVSARFQTLDVVRAAVVPVVVTDGAVQRLSHGRTGRMSLNGRDFESLAGAGSIKRFRVGGVEFRARASRNPFGATIALAVPEGGAEKLKGNEGSRVELDPGLAGSWVFLLDADQTRATAGRQPVGTLIAFLAEGDDNAQIGRMLPDVQHRLPGTATRLAGLVHQAPAQDGAKGKGKGKRGSTAGPEPEAAVPADPAAVIEDLGRPVEVVPEPEVPASPEVPPAPTASDAPAAPEPPSPAPLGFGGQAAVRPPVAQDPPPSDDPGDGEPPLGFSGRPTT